jgi:hypothetical protein
MQQLSADRIGRKNCDERKIGAPQLRPGPYKRALRSGSAALAALVLLPLFIALLLVVLLGGVLL